MKASLNLLCLMLLFISLDNGCSTSLSPISVNRPTVVIIEETEQRQSIPSSQLSAITSQIWRNYVFDKKGQWRVLDPHTDLSQEEDWVKQSLSIDRGILPWVIISTSNKGYSGPLPKNIDEFMERIKNEF